MHVARRSRRRAVFRARKARKARIDALQRERRDLGVGFDARLDAGVPEGAAHGEHAGGARDAAHDAYGPAERLDARALLRAVRALVHRLEHYGAVLVRRDAPRVADARHERARICLRQREQRHHRRAPRTGAAPEPRGFGEPSHDLLVAREAGAPQRLARVASQQRGGRDPAGPSLVSLVVVRSAFEERLGEARGEEGRHRVAAVAVEDGEEDVRLVRVGVPGDRPAVLHARPRAFDRGDVELDLERTDGEALVHRAPAKHAPLRVSGGARRHD